MPKFRKKPVVIEAVHYDWNDQEYFMDQARDDVADFMDRDLIVVGDQIIIDTLEGQLTASKGDWIIKGVQGEFYPCKPDIFAATYEAASCQSVSLRITGPNSDGEYWLHLKNGNGPQSAGINLGGEQQGMMASVAALLKAAAAEAPVEAAPEIFAATCEAAEPKGMDFGDAIRAMKAGAKVARAGWNGKGMWVAMTPGSTFPAFAAKDGHAAAHRAAEVGHGGEINLLPHIDMRAADGSLVVGWLASQTDMLAEDWEEVVF